MLGNRLAWENKLLTKNKIAVKEITNMLLTFGLICLLLQIWRGLRKTQRSMGV